jgi:hypothetical protein
MSWIKKGLIFKVEDHDIPWVKSHSCVPTVYVLDENTIRIFYAPRNNKGQSILTYFDIDAKDPSKIKYVHKTSIMPLGDLGTFDDGGIMPCCVVPVGKRLYLYYVGWNPSVSVPYRNAIGLAISDDQGASFYRPFPGALVDRNRLEPYFTASPWIMRESDKIWHMWYASSTGFITLESGVEPLYVIKYASSIDGIDWERKNQVCIIPTNNEESTARATVILGSNGIYNMWFAYRGSRDFRDGADAYKIGRAQSKDAINWERMDSQSGIAYSESGWDSTMQTYPCVTQVEGKKYLFYNGNGFGATGIGYAVWDEKK